MVNASVCGTEDRRFESDYPPLLTPVLTPASQRRVIKRNGVVVAFKLFLLTEYTATVRFTLKFTVKFTINPTIKFIKAVSLAAALLMTLCVLAACSAQVAQTQSQPQSAQGGAGDGTVPHKLRVVTSIFPPYDFARAVSGGIADVTMLLPPGAESHSYDPSPADMEKIETADVFFYIGGESDEWAKRVLAASSGNVRAVPLIDAVPTLTEEVVGNMQDDEADAAGSGDTADAADADSEVGEIDEHIWTSPKNAILIVNEVARVMSEADPDNVAAYAANSIAYSARLTEIDYDYRDIVERAVRKTLVFGDRFPFRYFAEEYGLSYDAAFPGCSVEGDASARTLSGLIDFVKTNKIPVVLKIELSGGKVADAVARESGAVVMELNSAHNISREDFDSGRTYADIMEANEAVLEYALCDS